MLLTKTRHSIRRFWNLIAVHAALGLALCGGASAASYNAVTDFSLASNPTSVWSYGSLSAYTGGTFSLYTSSQADGNFPGSQVWYNGQGQPNTASVLRDNTDGTQTNGGSVFYYPGLLELDGQNLITTVRWTAPAAGTYSVTGLFQRTDNSGNGPVSVRVVKNGTTILFSADNFVTFGSQETFNLASLSLPAGTTLDFEQGAGQFNNDSTGLAVTISTTTPNIAAIHYTNESSQDAKTVLNGGSPFTTDFKGVNDVTITPSSGTTVDEIFTDNYGSNPGNNPGYLTSFLGAAANGTGDGSVGGIDLLGPQLTAPYSFQYDFKQPLTSGDRIIIADVDEGEQFQIKAYQLVNGSYVALNLTGWTHEQFSGQSGDTSGSTSASWDPSTGTLTAGVSSNLNEPLDVFTPDKTVDRLIFNGLVSNDSDVEIQIVEVSGLPVITSALTATATVGTAFSYQIQATGNPASFSVLGLPKGFMVNRTTGVISGTPTAVGTYKLTIRATGATGTGMATLTLTVKPLAPSITSATSATATDGKVFSYQITATNSPTSYGVVGLPPGLHVDAQTGLISGTPTVSGTKTLTLKATNAGGSGTATLTLNIKGPIPVITSPATATATVGKAFNYQIKATNGPTSYSVGGLKDGLSLDRTTGLISGTPTTSGTLSLTLRAANGSGTGSAALTLTINP